MTTLFGGHPSPTQEEIQALVRSAHMERAQVMRDMLTALFKRPRPAASSPVDHKLDLPRAA